MGEGDRDTVERKNCRRVEASLTCLTNHWLGMERERQRGEQAFEGEKKNEAK